ncbi:MAG: YkgJ family cysteine cluster protein [Pyrinomonadaceae bacterium]|nr:YkgJ family cysteine cluster protein [Pyrinomonadaceae bacterium]
MSALPDSNAFCEQSPAPVGPVVTPTASRDEPVTQLERQVERGSFFTHTVLGENRVRLNEVESFTYGLIDALVAKGVVSADEVSEATQHVRDQLVGQDVIGVALTPETAEPKETPVTEVDCAARMHVCKAVCCKLDFPLSIPEIEGGEIKWDLGRPYLIRHESDGYCTHVDRETGGCGVYANRPSICRGYSCANDARIWKDFDKMELNNEWITEHLYESRPRALRVLMDYTRPACANADGEGES